jgi:YegS/Rv2252/BmrU family lipid kinase
VIGRRRPGRPIRRAVKDTRQRLEAAGWTVEASVVSRKKALRRHAAAAVSAGMDVVVAVGGDGAVLQVVQRVGGSPTALAIIPMGTGNLLATNLGIPRAREAAVEAILGGDRRSIDLGHASVRGKERLFSVACGIGFDAEVMRATTRRGKSRWGRLAYVASAVAKSGRVRDVEHLVTVDGSERRMPAMQVFLANFAGAGLPIKPRLPIEPDDGVLDLVVLRAPGRVRAVAAAWDALRQSSVGRSHTGRVYRARVKNARIDTSPARLVEVDGSVLGKTPVTISVRPNALTVLVPRRTS